MQNLPSLTLTAPKGNQPVGCVAQNSIQYEEPSPAVLHSLSPFALIPFASSTVLFLSYLEHDSPWPLIPEKMKIRLLSSLSILQLIFSCCVGEIASPSLRSRAAPLPLVVAASQDCMWSHLRRPRSLLTLAK